MSVKRKITLAAIGVVVIVTTGVVIGLSFGPERVGGPGNLYEEDYFRVVSWPLPDDHGIYKFISLAKNNCTIGPYEVEIEDDGGNLYHRVGEKMYLGDNFETNRTEIFLPSLWGMFYVMERGWHGSGDSTESSPVSPAFVSGKEPGLSAQFPSAPVYVRITIGKKYYFEWNRD